MDIVADVKESGLFEGTITAEIAGLGITVIWGKRSVVYQKRKVALHAHMAHEIHGLYSGKALVESANRTIELNAGEIAFIPSHTYHSVSNESETFELMALDFMIFKSRQPQDAEEERMHQTVDAMNSSDITILRNQPDILYVISFLNELSNTPMLADNHLARSYAGVLLLLLIRAFDSIIKASASQRSVDVNTKHLSTPVQLERMVIIENYFTTRYATATIDELADGLCLSKQHMRRFLRSNYNMSFSELLNKYRIIACQSMLRDTEKSITEIWNLAGFNSAQSFAVIFKKYTGCSPTQYRFWHMI